MKNPCFITAALLACTLEANGRNFVPREVVSPIEKVFAPNGFDNNDHVQVIVSGTYPNACYKVARTGFSIDPNTRQIKVWASSYEYSQNQPFCAQMRVPFTQVVDIGLLKEGQYEIHVMEPSAKQAIQIHKATVESPDEALYAPVTSVVAKTQSVVLSGEFPRLLTGCMKITHIGTDVDPGDVLVLRPEAEIFPEEECLGVETKFSVEAGLPYPINRETLIHTRVTNGSSLNLVVR
jgi:hypothetical protein